MQIRFHLDESVSNAVAHGLRRRGFDVTTSKEANLLSATDSSQLAFALHEARVLVTHDDDFLRLHNQSVRHSGIAYAHQKKITIGHTVLALVELARKHTSEEMSGRVVFLRAGATWQNGGLQSIASPTRNGLSLHDKVRCSDRYVLASLSSGN